MKPTVGRVMLYRSNDGLLNASMVAFVHNDEGTLVNLSVIDASGVQRPVTSVQVFDGPQDDIPVTQCGWMDYQRNVATLDQLQKQEAPPASQGTGQPSESPNIGGIDFGSDSNAAGSGTPG